MRLISGAFGILASSVLELHTLSRVGYFVRLKFDPGHCSLFDWIVTLILPISIVCLGNVETGDRLKHDPLI